VLLIMSGSSRSADVREFAMIQVTSRLFLMMIERFEVSTIFESMMLLVFYK